MMWTVVCPSPKFILSFREHGMKRMGNHGGSIGSQHQLGAGMGSGQNLMSESYQQGQYSQRYSGVNDLWVMWKRLFTPIPIISYKDVMVYVRYDV